MCSDPLAEKHYGVSGYADVLNNPLVYINPLGLDTVKASNIVANRSDLKQFDVNKDVVQLNKITISAQVPTKSASESLSDLWKAPWQEALYRTNLLYPSLHP